MKAYIDDKKRIRIKNIINNVAFYTVAFIVFTAIFSCIGTTETRQQDRLIKLLDDHFAEYSVLDMCGYKYFDNNDKYFDYDDINFHEFYVSSSDTLYKCKYTASSNELHMEKVSELPIILRGCRDDKKE